MHSNLQLRLFAIANSLLICLVVAASIATISPTIIASAIGSHLSSKNEVIFEAPVNGSVSGVNVPQQQSNNQDFYVYREGTAQPLTNSTPATSKVAKNNSFIAHADDSHTIIAPSGYMVPIVYSYISRGIIPGVHTGIDFVAPTGTPIWAAADGVVTTSDASGYNGGWGKTIVITHQTNVTTRYAHMSKLIVKEGDQVKRGQIIGYSGSTGRSTGPHLHFELRINGKTKNPFSGVL